MWEGTHNQLWLASPIGGGTIWGEMGEARGVDWLGDPQTLFSQDKRKKKKKKKAMTLLLSGEKWLGTRAMLGLALHQMPYFLNKIK